MKIFFSGILFLSIFFGFFCPIQAQTSLEDQAKEIESLLIAPCCWTAPVSEHHSQIAYQMRDEIRTFLNEGKTKEEILSIFEKKYGERILAAPKVTGFSAMAWIFPFFIFLIGIAVVFFALRYFKAKPGLSEKEPQNQLNEDRIDQKYRDRLDKELYRDDSLSEEDRTS